MVLTSQYIAALRLWHMLKHVPVHTNGRMDIRYLMLFGVARVEPEIATSLRNIDPERWAEVEDEYLFRSQLPARRWPKHRTYEEVWPFAKKFKPKKQHRTK